MTSGAPRSFGAQLKSLREAAGFTQEELATIAGLSANGVSALERGTRRRPHVETVRALAAALEVTGEIRDTLIRSARAAPTQVSPQRHVPVAVTALLGRENEMQTLRQWLADPTVRLITLIGPGGSGKTRLALELAHDHAAHGTSRVIFVGLAATRIAFVAAAIAEALGVVDASPLGLPRRARAACDGTPTLLVLDNFEHVLDAAPLVADLLATVAALRVLATSRAPLHVRGEREYSVGPLAWDDDVDATSPAALARVPAVRLFVERVRDMQPGFRLTAANGPVVDAICRRLDALPLALELAAPWLKVLTADDLLRRLTRDVLLPSVGPRDLPDRQQTINATVAWSYQLLGPSEQRVFRRLGALPGRFSIEAAAAVLAGRTGSPVSSGEALTAVAGLIDRSLILRAETSVAERPLYEMLETVRAYAALELTAAGERDEAMERLAGYCTREAAVASEGMTGPAQIEWLDRVRDELESYRSAMAWLIEHTRPAEAAAVATGLMLFWLIRGHLSEGLQWYEQTLKLPSLAPSAEAGVLAGAALMSYTQGDLGRAQARLTRAMALARSTNETVVLVVADNLFGHVDHALGDLDSARERFTRTLEVFRQFAIPWGVGNALSGMAGVALEAGDVGEAERLLVEATDALRHVGPWFQTPNVNLLGIAAVRRGNADEAFALVRENLTHIRQLQDSFSLVYALVTLAAAAGLKGDDTWAARILGAGNSVTERTGATVVDKSVRDLRDQTEREVRARLGQDRWSRAYAAGRATSIDSLIADIDQALTRARA